MTQTITFDPFFSWPVLLGLSALCLLLCLLNMRLSPFGGVLRLCGFAVTLLALTQPALEQTETEALPDIALIVMDETSSQDLGNRTHQNQQALERLMQELARLDVEPRLKTVRDDAEDRGTLLMSGLAELLETVPLAQVSGAFLITDGLLQDAELGHQMPAPLHALLTGEASDWDRRLIIENAPNFAVLGEEFEMTLRVEDEGSVPQSLAPFTTITITIGSDSPQDYRIPTNEDITLPLTLPHAGVNTLQFSLKTEAGELTERNNSDVVQINGVRDRLRVLLVSGEPHVGQRTWRNLLKSDTSVDLVHFTILRPPGKQDGVPVNELSLIAFPTRELFLEKIDDFDLIIFDRYQRRGILSPVYLDSVRAYVERGGALLIAAGPDFASADSLYRSLLSDVIPLAPTARLLEAPFTPSISEIGKRHPVTRGIDAPYRSEETLTWGRWFRQIELEAKREHENVQIVMTGQDNAPLLALSHEGMGRVALLASDHIWLWDRGVEGGGPQLELLKRLAHWMMREPELEEEAMLVQENGNGLQVLRQSLLDTPPNLTVIAPNGAQTVWDWARLADGQFSVIIPNHTEGVYQLESGPLRDIYVVGISTPTELQETLATSLNLTPLIEEQRGGVRRIEAGLPSLRFVRSGALAHGRGWLGLNARNAAVPLSLSSRPLLPAWLYLLAGFGFILGAWLWEGRRKRPQSQA